LSMAALLPYSFVSPSTSIMATPEDYKPFSGNDNPPG
jgi:hypothetical protein